MASAAVTSKSPLRYIQLIPGTQSTFSEASANAAQDVENSIVRFQAIPTDDDRTRLQKQKGAQHNTQSVIKLTAELDEADPKRRGKSIVSGLATLL
ncbi:hypothetical protein F53441_12548 [Fusarium austroafricanum]|uniref:Uncharacterized protein n=1 Tax=Fusarium austroafricanum TaxID=2364996 RepID=A0A8H4NVG4_9HYPO|nr:hypothetical protein F53441_12548 [Fusarium austroafricanum]